MFDSRLVMMHTQTRTVSQAAENPLGGHKVWNPNIVPPLGGHKVWNPNLVLSLGPGPQLGIRARIVCFVI